MDAKTLFDCYLLMALALMAKPGTGSRWNWRLIEEQILGLQSFSLIMRQMNQQHKPDYSMWNYLSVQTQADLNEVVQISGSLMKSKVETRS